MHTSIDEQMIDSLATRFERKILFGLGRHLWNVVGVGGVIAIFTGVVFAITSNTKPILSFEDWYESKMNIRLDLHTSDYESHYLRPLPGIGDYCLKRIKAQRQQGFVLEELQQLKIQQKHINKFNPDAYEQSCAEYMSILAGLGFTISPMTKGEIVPFDSRINDKTPEEYKQLYLNKKDEYNNYASNAYESNLAARGRGALSPVLLTWGAGVVAAVSVISAILAVERNTRKL